MKKLMIGLLFCGVGVLHAQDNGSALQQLMKQDSADINTLAAYPENVRQNIFEVATHPEGVAKLNDLQKKSNEDFKNLLSPYSKDEQEKIWNLTRYEGLIDRLASGGKKTESEIEDILKKFPKDIHDDALNYALHHDDLLAGIDRLNKQFSDSFDGIIKSYPEKTQSSFRELIKTPEVVTILNTNMNMTVRLGDIYKTNPQLVKQNFDNLNLQLAQQKANDLEDWKQTMKNDPDAKNELKQSAEQYANENGYKETDYRNTDPMAVEHYVYVPYPYWCGYPWWHTDPYWYPYPFWYHWGFYYWHNDFVWMGPPSWYFIHWHFHHHPYIYNYPHLTNSYLHYYHGPRRAVVTNSREVNQWVRENRKSLPKGFFKNDAQRVDRIKEYGKFEMNYDEHIRSNPGQPVKREEFLQQHASEFPHMQPAIKEPIKPGENVPVRSFPEKNRETPQPRDQPPVRNPLPTQKEQPMVHPQKSDQPMQLPPKQKMQEQPRSPREIRQNQPAQPRPRIDSKPRRKSEIEGKKKSTSEAKDESLRKAGE